MSGTKKSASKFAAKLPEFPCPTWNVKTKQLDFPPGTPPGRGRDSAEYWFPKIGDMLKPGFPGMTNRKRKDLSRLRKELAAFLAAFRGPRL
jgi:hypothetical protein